MNGISRRDLIVAGAALTLFGCGENDSLVTVAYRPLVNFKSYRWGEDMGQSRGTVPSAVMTMIEVVRVENMDPKATEFTFNTGAIGMVGGDKIAGFFQPLTGLKDLGVDGSYSETIAAHATQDYPKPQPVLSGPSGQTLQHLRLVLRDNNYSADDQHVMANLSYANSVATQRVLMVRTGSIAPIPFLEEITTADLINTIFAGTFF